MNFSIATTMRHLLSPQHELSCSWILWRRLARSLRLRGKNGCHESGAFLLGYRSGCRTRITDFVLYDDLDPNSLRTGIVRFDGRYYGDLWQICNKRQLVVVADVHTHPAGPAQSISDRANPMIASAGHIAIIIPNFAQPPVRRAALGIYRYMGSRKWFEVPERDRAAFFHIGF